MPEKIEKKEITEELRESYLDYAMSVIVSRALPDVRDGLKPVQRRILWAMWDMGLTSKVKFVKSARIVGECFAKDTLILTKKGLVPIQCIKIGDEVYTQNGIEKAVQLYKMPAKPLLKITLENGLSNIVTHSQKFKVLTKNWKFEWKEAKDLTKNDSLVLKANYPKINELVLLNKTEKGQPFYLNENVAYFLGIFISEGSISNDYSKKKLPRISIANNSPEIIKKIVYILNQEFGYKATIETNNYKILSANGKVLNNKKYSVRINRKKINEFFVSNFKLENKHALTKEIPQQIFNSPKEIISAFISGLIDGDGSIHKSRNTIHYGSISEKLIRQIQIILQHQGIFTQKYCDASIRSHFINGRRVNKSRPFYYLEAKGENAAKLASELKLVENVKNKRALELGSKKFTSHERKGWNKYDLIPYAGKMLFQELSENHIGSGWYQNINGEKFRMGIKYPMGCKIRYSSNLLEKPLRKTQVIDWGIKNKLERIGSPLFGFLEHIIQNKIYFLRLKSIEKVEPQETYDFEVEGDHEFIANGVISHNCLGKYHPHGDIAVYDALVRMEQDFSLREPLIEGQGNFGSTEDAPAAQRYTEARLSKIAEELLADIEKETVDWQPNYDNSRLEPKVLPAKFPNLLVNGAMGIAVGMATNIPPHNLGEVAEAAIYLIDNPKAEIKDLTKLIPGPDFPTGGLIYTKSMAETYALGKGSITMQATAEIQEQRSNQFDIVVTEIPYQVNKSELIVKIAELVQEKKIEGIRDIRDESDREGLRIVIELKNDANPQKILNFLYKHTELQKDFHLNMLALLDGLQPQVMSLKDILEAWIKHRQEVIKKRTEFDLKKAEERAHILIGLVKALEVIDEVIATIKKSKDRETAHQNLVKRFKFSDLQAAAILEMKLQTLAALERQKLEDELKEKKKLISELQFILKNPKEILSLIKTELTELKKIYNEPRKTKIISSEVKEFRDEDLIPQKDTIITLSQGNYIKRLAPAHFRIQKRGGKGLIGFELKEEDFVTQILAAKSHDNVLFFTDRGRVFQTKAYEIPEASRTAKGKSIYNFLDLSSNERISAIIAYGDSKSAFLVMATKNGFIKKTSLDDFTNIRRNGLIAIKLKKDDFLNWVKLSSGQDEIILTTSRGQAIRFPEKQVRSMGRTASGVKAIRLKKDDAVAGLDIIKESQKSLSAQAGKIKSQKLLVVTEKGFGKQTLLAQYRIQSRAGSGIKTAKITPKTGPIIASQIIDEAEEILAISAKGQILKTEISSIRLAGRATQGVKIINLDAGDKLVGIITI